MVCRKCGSEMPDGLRYCGQCGRKMGIVEFVLFTGKGRLILAAVVAVLGIAAATVGLLGGFGEEGSSGESDALGQVDVRTLQESLELEMLMGQAEEKTAYLQVLDEMNSYEVLDFTQEEGLVYARVKVTAPDMYHVAKEMEEIVFASEEDANTVAIACMEAAELLETELTVIFYADGGTWEPMLTEEFVDAYYGGLLTYREEYLAGLEGGQ